MSFKGIDVRQSGDRIIFRAAWDDGASPPAALSSGTATVALLELQSDGTVKTYDWSSHTFKTSGMTSSNSTASLTHRNRIGDSDASVATGIWTKVESTLTGFTRGNIYFANFSHSTGGIQSTQFQYGEGEGDFAISSAGKTTATLAAADVSGNLPADLKAFDGIAGYVAVLIGILADYDFRGFLASLPAIASGPVVSSTATTLDIGPTDFFGTEVISIAAGSLNGLLLMVRYDSGSYEFRTVIASEFTGHVVLTIDRAWDTNPTNADSYILLAQRAPQFPTTAQDVTPADGSITAAKIAASALDGKGDWNTDKAGYKLASDGLDSISTTAPAGVASTFREMVVQTWRRFFAKATKTDTQIKTYADNGTTVLTTQTISDSGGTETQGKAS